MAEAIVDVFQPIQVKEQNSELARGAFGALDLRVNCFHQMTVIGQSSQRILGCLLAQVIFKFSLLGDVLDDNLVAASLLIVADLASAEPDFESRAVLPPPLSFQGIGATRFLRVAEQLCSFRGIAKYVACKIHGQEFLAG